MIKDSAKNYCVNGIRIKFNNRLEELEQMGIYDNLDSINMRNSKKTLLSFLDSVEFKDYYSVILDDDGYYSIRMKNKSSLFIVTFKENGIHYYYNNFKNKSHSGDKPLESFFKSKIEVEFYSDFFSIRKKPDGFLWQYTKNNDISYECINRDITISC